MKFKYISLQNSRSNMISVYLSFIFHGKCSADCGEGVHKRQLYCSATEEKCNQMQRPLYQKRCKHQLPCGGKWFTGPWQKVANLYSILGLWISILC